MMNLRTIFLINLLLLLLVVVVVALAVSSSSSSSSTDANNDADGGASPHPSFYDIYTDRSCYEQNNTIHIYGTISSSSISNMYDNGESLWIGIYQHDFVPSEEPIWWMYLANCNNDDGTSDIDTATAGHGTTCTIQSTSTTETSIHISIDLGENVSSRDEEEEDKEICLLLPYGSYRAVLAQDPPPPPPPTTDAQDNNNSSNSNNTLNAANSNENDDNEDDYIILATSTSIGSSYNRGAQESVFYIARGTACTREQQQQQQQQSLSEQQRQQRRLQDTIADTIVAARDDIISLIRADGTLPGRFLRLVFHDCIGGRCDGCINMRNPDHAGTPYAMNALQGIVDAYSSRRGGLSRADIWALASFVGVELLMPSDNAGRIDFTFRHYGRRDCDDTMTSGPDPPICEPDMGTNEILEFFDEQFGFSPREVAAIMGAHTVGVMRREDLGFDGENGWVFDEETFDNGFHQALTGRNGNLNSPPGWRQNFVRNGGDLPDRWQWEAFPGGEKAVMLNADIALVRQLDRSRMDSRGRVNCDFRDDCPFARDSIFQPMLMYARDNRRFLRDFYAAYEKMVDVGYRVDDETCDIRGVCRLRPR